MLHVLFDQAAHNISETIELCKRLIDGGADINALDKRNISVMQHVVNIGIHEGKLEPLYDIIFSQPKLDFNSKNFLGFSPMDLAIKHGNRPKLVERMREFEQRDKG